jgi:uroporphyrinogen decarboxylase
MQDNLCQWFDQLRLSRDKRPLPILSFPGIQLLGVSVRELVRDGHLQAQCMRAIAQRYSTAASLTTMDLSIEAEAFGASIVYSDTEVPTVTGRLIDSVEHARDLPVPPVGAGRTAQCLMAIAEASRHITDRPIFGGLIGPFSLAGRLMDMSEIMVQCIENPDLPHQVLQKTTQFIKAYAMEIKAAGAHGIVMAEPAAGLLSPAHCMEFSTRYIRQIVDAVQDDNFLVIYHNCGNTTRLVAPIIATGARAIHLGNAIRLPDVIGQYPSEKLILGNIDPAGQFRHGTPDSMHDAVTTLLNQLKSFPNFVISSGCDIPPLTPIENIDAFFSAVRQFHSTNHPLTVM